MASAFVDSLPEVKTLFANAWTASNTDNRTPQFIVMNDDADSNSSVRYDAGNTDFVFVYLVTRTNGYAGINVIEKEVRDAVTLDLRTAQTRTHHMKALGEIDRILDTNLLNPITGFYINYPGNFNDFSDKSRRLWRHTVDIELVNYALARGT
jgi:hypothetical protein